MRNFVVDSVITCLDINNSSNLLIIGTYDNNITLFDIRSRNLIAKLIAHSEPITSVSFTEDSTMFFSTSYDTFCRAWDVLKFACLKTYAMENDFIIRPYDEVFNYIKKEIFCQALFQIFFPSKKSAQCKLS